MAFDGESWDGSEEFTERGGDPSGYRAILEEVRAKRLAFMTEERLRLVDEIEQVLQRAEAGVHNDMDKALEIQKLKRRISELDAERSLLERSKREIEVDEVLSEDGPGGHLVTVTLSAYAWGNVLEALAHLTSIRGSFYSQAMAAELWDLIASQTNGAPIKIHRWWEDEKRDEETSKVAESPKRRKILGLF